MSVCTLCAMGISREWFRSRPQIDTTRPTWSYVGATGGLSASVSPGLALANKLPVALEWDAEPGAMIRRRNNPPQNGGLLKTRLTGLEPATSGVTGRRSRPIELQPHFWGSSCSTLLPISKTPQSTSNLRGCQAAFVKFQAACSIASEVPNSPFLVEVGCPGACGKIV